MRPDFKAFTPDLLKGLSKQTTRQQDLRALRQAMRRNDLHATIYWLTWICAEPQVTNWLQEMFYFSGPNISRAMSPIQNHLNTDAAYMDLFSWLAPKAHALLVSESLERYSPAARAKYVLGHVTKKDFDTWRRGQDTESIQLKDADKEKWKRRVQLRSRWRFKTLLSEHRVKRFVKFLRASEAADTKRPRQRIRLVDHRAAQLPAILMRDIQRREFQDLARDPQVQRLAKRTRP